MEAVPSSVHIQSAEISILQKAQERLESSLRTECMQRFGVPIELDITLTQEGQTVQAGSAGFTILSECTDAEKQQVAAYLQEALGTASVGRCRRKSVERNRGLFHPSLCRKMQRKAGRARLAAAVGLLAMLLILLSGAFPATSAGRQHPESQKHAKQHRISGTIGGAAGTADLSYERCGQDHCDGHTGDWGGNDLCIGHAVRRLAVAADACLAGGWFCPGLRRSACPQVCRVAVLCEGGGDVRVAVRITELVSALLDLPSNHICVEQRKG